MSRSGNTKMILAYMFIVIPAIFIDNSYMELIGLFGVVVFSAYVDSQHSDYWSRS